MNESKLEMKEDWNDFFWMRVEIMAHFLASIGHTFGPEK